MLLKLTQKDRLLLNRLNVPEPDKSIETILQELMVFRNEWTLHRRTCDVSKKPIISAYPEPTIFPVYKNDIWWGDSWDPKKYGREVDLSKSFTDQFFSLQCEVPREGTSVFNSENCDFNSHTRESKNCYLNSLVYRCEDTYYSYWAASNKDVFDCYLINNCTLSYNCIDGELLYGCIDLQDCYSCTGCMFGYQLRSCEDCIFCANLVNKKFYAFNKPVSEEEFRKIKSQYLNGSHKSYEEGKEIYEKMLREALHRALHNVNTENCIGDHLINCKNCFYSFDGNESEDVSYSVSFNKSKNILACYSAGWPDCEEVYMSAVTRGSQNIAFCYYTFFSSGLRYCDSSMSCHDCFGCVGLRNVRNCIFNKPYSVHEYEVMTKKLIAHMNETKEWGSYFAKELSTFPYNQSAANQYFPLNADDAVSKGWIWRDVPSTSAQNSKDFPEHINEVTDELLGSVYTCSETKNAFKLIKPEVEFYRKMSLPPPRTSPYSRHLKRMKRRNKYAIYSAKCAVTGEEIQTTFPPDGGLKVVSENAYFESLV